MRFIRVPATTVVALALLVPMGAASRASATPLPPGPASTSSQGRPQVDWVGARCVGDTLAGVVQAQGAAGQALTLILLQRRHGGTSFAPSGRTLQLKLSGGTRHRARYRFRLPIGGLDARAYQVAVKPPPKHRAVRSPVLPAAECAPEPMVPEAALPIALPASMLVTLAAVGLPAARRARALRRLRHVPQHSS